MGTLQPRRATLTDKRRSSRIPLRCTAVVREKMATWTTETHDVSARGCRIALKRPLTPGAVVHLRIERGPGEPPLEFVGQVAWARKTAPLTAGVTFVSAPRDVAGAANGGWIDTLVLAELRRLLQLGPEATGALTSLGGVALHLGTPPSTPLARAELAVLRAAKDGAPLSTVCGSPDALMALVGALQRGAVTVRRTNQDPDGWKRAFSLLVDAVSAGNGQPPVASSDAVIVTPPPATLWRRPALEALIAESLQPE
jgi:PilZ domain